MWHIVGLGNPGEEYEETRHNTGRLVLEMFRRAERFPEWKPDEKTKALVSGGKIGKESVTLLEPETFMNRSGATLGALAGGSKRSERLVVIHDDLDLPFGSFKISFNRSAGGHRGVLSVVKAVKTEAFTRIRVGISPRAAKGTAKKPKGEKAVIDFILKPFKKSELAELRKNSQKIAEALRLVITGERDKAMSRFNADR